MLAIVEYIWIDGTKPTQMLRSKARIVDLPDHRVTIDAFPEWSFDGSSTGQATGDKSDCILKPVNFILDPLRPEGYLVLCEVFNEKGLPHASNSRAVLRKILENGGDKHDAWIGFEQEYTLYQGRIPLGWPEQGYPAPQGPYYCGVGAERVFGRNLVEMHTQACLDAGIMLYGINAEVMPGQWEFQIGYRGLENEPADALNICDHRNFALWLLHRLGEELDITVNTENKPIKGDWNGAGCHTNFSTKETRDPKTGISAIEKAIKSLEKKHADHIAIYGFALAERLTGLHETCDINTFRAGVSDRGASIRIPKPVQQKGYGYFEDRRPGANSDGYLVAAMLIATVCGIDDKPVKQFCY